MLKTFKFLQKHIWKRRFLNCFILLLFFLITKILFIEKQWEFMKTSVYNSLMLRKELRKLVADPTFDSYKIIHNSLLGVEMVKWGVVLNHHIYIGLFIIELSEILMHNFHSSNIKIYIYWTGWNYILRTLIYWHIIFKQMVLIHVCN